MEDQRTQPQPHYATPPNNDVLSHFAPARKSRFGAIIASLLVLLLVAAGGAAFYVLSKNNSSSNAMNTYQRKLTSALTPVVNDNVALSKGLKAVDGSSSTLQGATNATQTAQQDTTSARGALAAVSVPSAGQTLNQQATQALTQEGGYLQAVSSTLSNPSNSSAGSLQSLASATNAAFVPLNTVADGGSTSVYGVDNLLSWVSGAQAAAQKAHDAQQAQQQQPNVTNNNYYSNGGDTSGQSTVNDSTDTDTVSPMTPTYCSNGVYVGADVTCGFAENVFDSVYSQWDNNGNVFPSNVYSVNSPATGQSYDLTLVSSTPSWALYENNNGGYVSIGEYALSVY